MLNASHYYRLAVGWCCIAALLSGCAAKIPPCPPPRAGDVVYVVGRDWHAEIGFPANEMGGALAFYRNIFPGARVIMFGYGKRTFFTAPTDSINQYLLGPFPGDAAIHAVALSVTPPEAYPPEDVVTLALPQGGAKALTAFIAGDLARDGSGKPKIISYSHNPEGLFYAASSRYTLLHTCNTWTADALHAAGLPVDGNGVTFASQVMEQAVKACRNKSGAR